MLKLKKVAVTGDIASGKSTICRFFEELGCYVVSSDDLVNELLIPNSEIGKKIISLLGDQILQKGKLDKKKIAEKVFSSPALLDQLEKLLHPEVQRLIEERYLEALAHPPSLFLAEVPLLFEAKLEKFYDVIILVTAESKLRAKRFHSSRLFSLSELKRREGRLLPFAEKVKRSHFIIENNGDEVALREKVKAIFNQLI